MLNAAAWKQRLARIRSDWMHLPQGVDERALSAAGAAQRLWLRPLGRHRLGEASGAGLVLGYAGVEERALHTAAHVLADLLEAALDPPNPV